MHQPASFKATALNIREARKATPAMRVARGESDLFLMGLLSLIDAMLETPMEAVLEKIPLNAPTKSVLLGQPRVLRPVFQLMLAHESGKWETAAALSEGVAPRRRRRRCCGTPIGRFNSGRESSLWKSRSTQGNRVAQASMVLLCKTKSMGALRGSPSASTIKLFSFGPRSREGLLRQPFRGGAFTDPISGKSKPI